MKFEEKLTEEEWYKKKSNEGTLFGINWIDIKSWIDDGKCKGFDVNDYIHKQKVKEAIERLIARNEEGEPSPDAETCGYTCGLVDLKKELGLE